MDPDKYLQKRQRCLRHLADIAGQRFHSMEDVRLLPHTNWREYLLAKDISTNGFRVYSLSILGGFREGWRGGGCRIRTGGRRAMGCLHWVAVVERTLYYHFWGDIYNRSQRPW